MSLYDDCRTFGMKLSEKFIEEDSKTNNYGDFDELKSKLLSIDFEKNVILNQYFPPDVVNETVEFELEGPAVLQIDSRVKIAEPFINRKFSDQPRLLSLQLTDGHKKVNAVELEYLDGITTSVRKGTKILFLGGKVVNGKLGLTSINCQFLGGGASHKFRQANVDASYRATVEIITQREVQLSQGVLLDPSNFAVKPTSRFAVLSLPSLEVMTLKPVDMAVLEGGVPKAATPTGPTLSIAEILAKARAAVPTTSTSGVKTDPDAGAATSSWYQPASPTGRKPIVRNIKPDQSTRQQQDPAARKLAGNQAGARQPRVEPALRTHYAIVAPQDDRRDSRQEGRGGRGSGRQEPLPRFQREREAPQRGQPRVDREAPARREQTSRPPASSGIVYSATPPQSSGIVYSTTAPTAKSKPGSIRPNNHAPPPGISNSQPKSGITYSATPPVTATRSSGIVYSSTPPVSTGRGGGKDSNRHRDDRDHVDYSDSHRNDRGGDRDRAPRERNERVPREYTSRGGTQYTAEPVPDFAQDPARRERTPRERLPAKDSWDNNRERTPRERLPETNIKQSKQQEVRYVDNVVEPPRGARDRAPQRDSSRDIDASQESGSLSQRIAQAVAQPVAAHFVPPELRNPEPVSHRHDTRPAEREAPRRHEETRPQDNRPRFQDSRHEQPQSRQEPPRQSQDSRYDNNKSDRQERQEPRRQDVRQDARGGQDHRQDARGGQQDSRQQDRQQDRPQDRHQDSRYNGHDDRRDEPRRDAAKPAYQGGHNGHQQQQQQQPQHRAPVVPVVQDTRTAEERIASELEKIDAQRRQKREQSRGGGGVSAPFNSLFESNNQQQNMPEPPMRELQPFFAAGQNQDFQPLKAAAPAQLQRFQPPPAAISPVSPPVVADWKTTPNNPNHALSQPHYAAPQDRQPVHQQQQQQQHEQQAKVAQRPPAFQGQYSQHDDRGAPQHHQQQPPQQQQPQHREAPRPVPDASGKVMGISQENIQRILEQQNREAQQQQRMSAQQPVNRGQFQPNRLFNNALNLGADRERGGRGGRGGDRDDDSDGYAPPHHQHQQHQQQQAPHHQQPTHHLPPQQHQQHQQQGRGGDERQHYAERQHQQHNDRQYSQQQQQQQQQQHWH